MEHKHVKVAEAYFEAFHDGDLSAVFSQLDANCMVKYGKEKAQPAHEFYPAVAGLISTMSIETHGYYYESSTGNVIIHFSFSQTVDGEERITEAVDIIEFNDADEILSIKVLSGN